MRQVIPLPPAMLERLHAAYATPPRAYHHFGHVEAVLGHFDEVAAGPGWARPHETWLAMLYHDAIYDAGRRDNEARSARLAAQEIARWLPDAGIDVGHVVDLIELTARHGSLRPEALGEGPDGDDRRHFLDCDMAILGADAAAFDAYDRAIAEEYSDAVPGVLYRINRRRFLRGLVRCDRIYLSAFFHERLDAAARANLRRRLGVAG
ncbi:MULTISPECIES: HD domain-containing protein [unclassified Luteimonas]